MRWIYRLQQRIAITRSETNVLLSLVVLAGFGLAARHVQSQPQPLQDAAYAVEQTAFAQASAAPIVEARATALPAPAENKTVAPRSTRRTQTAPAPASINPNTATVAQLERLPRIGPKLAERILAYREAQGPFTSIQQLTRVKGIGKKTLAQMEPYLVIEG